jgi:hypothetical protein
MSQISTPKSARWNGRSTGDGTDSSSAASNSLALKMRVAASRDRLDRELAANADSDSSPELALRASQLTSDRRRKQLARTLNRVIKDAHSPRVTLPPVVLVNRAAVRDAEESIQALVARLRSAAPVRAEGMAIAERIVTDGAKSPLYLNGDRGALRQRVLGATAALDSPGAATHEWSLAA